MCVWPQLQVLLCLVDIASGMTYLHSVGVLHGDIKSANVLLKSTATDLRGFCCKIADFGCAPVPLHRPRATCHRHTPTHAHDHPVTAPCHNVCWSCRLAVFQQRHVSEQPRAASTTAVYSA